MLRSPGCEKCKKYNIDNITCAAYPKGIPDDIIFKTRDELKKLCSQFSDEVGEDRV